MATRVMVIWILSLQVFWASAFVLFTKHFDGAEFERRRVAVLEQKLHTSNRALARMEMNFSEYKDVIASSGVKINDKTKWNDAKRMVASVMADPKFKVSPMPPTGNKTFNDARKLYAMSDYRRSAEIFDDFVHRYPENPNLPEAYYLLSEAYFNTDQLEASVKAIDVIITQYPETEFAAYGMLRLAKIFEGRDRPEEAAQLYQSVMMHYPKSNAAAIAAKDFKDLPL